MKMVLNSICDPEIKNAWNRFIRSSLLNRSIRSASNREATPERTSDPPSFSRTETPAGHSATDCDILGYSLLSSQKGRIIPVLDDEPRKEGDPATGFIVSRFGGRTNERIVGAESVAVGTHRQAA